MISNAKNDIDVGDESDNQDDDQRNITNINPRLHQQSSIAPTDGSVSSRTRNKLNGALAQNIPSNNFDSHTILMKGITWSRDSHGLFDYESRHLTKKTLRAEKAMMLMRSSNELHLIPYHPEKSF